MFLRLAVAALALTLSLPAAAQVSVGVLPVTLEGELDSSMAPSFAESIAASLEASSVAVVPASRLAAAAGRDEAALASCTTGACLGELCSRGRVNAVLRAVVAGSLNMYTLSLEALAPGGQRLAAVERSCELCSQAEARAAMGEIAAEVADAIPRAGRAILSVSPAEAQVTVDGAPSRAGELRLPPGPHEAAASAEGYGPERRGFEVLLGVDTTVALALARLRGTDDRVPRQRGRLGPLGIAGIVLSGLGVAAAAASAAVLAIDGDCAGGRVDANGQCEFMYSTLAGGATGLALGISGLVSGVVMLIVDIVRGPGSSRGRATAGDALDLQGRAAIGRW
jgi:hypothetical protein